MDGILSIVKPIGPTSHDIVAIVRRLSGTKRTGHGGTLDPFAAGVLPIFLGRATRLVEYHLADDKEYLATVCFGASSSTDDLEGELRPIAGPPVEREAVEVALTRFTGPIRQRPPVYSAVQVGGQRAYAAARAGRSVAIPERDVVVHRLELVSWDQADPTRPVARVAVTCSAGTYVRAIARDLGEAVGSGAYLGALTRTRSGPFELEAAVSLETVRARAADGPEALRELLLPPDTGLEAMPAVALSATEVADVAQGRFIRPVSGVPAVGTDSPVRLVDPDGQLVGIGVRTGPRIAPRKILVDAPAPAPVVVAGAASGAAG
jgi:tRNA pseudouridine55 synthase